MDLTTTLNNETVSLNDICFKPLFPDNKDCAVMSVLQYWQLNETKIDKCMTNMEGYTCSSGFGTNAEDWHDQFTGCVK